MRKFLIQVLVTEEAVPTIAGLLAGECIELNISPAESIVVTHTEVAVDKPKAKRDKQKGPGITLRVLRKALEDGLHGDGDLARFFEDHFLNASSVSATVSRAVKEGWVVRGPGGIFLVKGK